MGTIYRNGVPFVGSGGAGGVEMTQAEYDLLPTSEKMNGAIYFITDGDVSYPSASQMRYDNTESQIPSTTVQGAIDENRIEINDLKSGLATSTNSISNTKLIAYFAKSGRTVTIFFDTIKGLTASSANPQIARLPEGFRPWHKVEFDLQNSSGDDVRVTIDNAGYIGVYNYTSITGTLNLSGTITFITPN